MARSLSVARACCIRAWHPHVQTTEPTTPFRRILRNSVALLCAGRIVDWLLGRDPDLDQDPANSVEIGRLLAHFDQLNRAVWQHFMHMTLGLFEELHQTEAHGC